MPKILYLSGLVKDEPAWITIQKAEARRCDLAIHVSSNFVRLYEMSSVSIKELGFMTNHTNLSEGPAYITQQSLAEVLETLSASFKMVEAK